MGEKGPAEISSDELFNGKKVVMFAVPGAFTPTCSETHLPGFIVSVDDIKAKGVDTVACVAVNDVFVMGAWAATQNAEHIMMLADGSADYVTALGLTLDLTARGLGMRADRFAMIVDDGVVTHLAREEPGKMDVSSAESILKAL
ncbi:UNVERIFIED_CONTAM: hypothetical protein GTU68_053995 [Idotea baltica]|nr:hypothetical protein [Idotea baltica]